MQQQSSTDRYKGTRAASESQAYGSDGACRSSSWQQSNNYTQSRFSDTTPYERSTHERNRLDRGLMRARSGFIDQFENQREYEGQYRAPYAADTHYSDEFFDSQSLAHSPLEHRLQTRWIKSSH